MTQRHGCPPGFVYAYGIKDCIPINIPHQANNTGENFNTIVNIFQWISDQRHKLNEFAKTKLSIDTPEGKTLYRPENSYIRGKWDAIKELKDELDNEGYSISL